MGSLLFAQAPSPSCLLVAVQGLLINLLGPRAFKKVSLYVQVLAMLGLLLMLFLLPIFSTLLPAWQQARSATALLAPTPLVFGPLSNPSGLG